MQKTVWTNFSSLLVTYVLGKGFNDGFEGQSRKNHFPENWAISGMVTNNRTLCCIWISKYKTSGVPFDDSRALLHCWALGNSIGITNSQAAITNHSQKLHCTYMSTSASWSGVPFDNSMALLQD